MIMNDCLVMETIGLVAVWDATAVELWYSTEKEAVKFLFKTSLPSILATPWLGSVNLFCRF